MARVITNRQAIAALGGEDARPALDSLGGQVAARAAQLAPRRTGALAGSIGHEVVSDGGEVVARVSFDSAHYYGFYVEVGTSRMSAQPFLRPALDGTYTP